MNPINIIYDTILYNYKIKKIATMALKNHMVTGNYVYRKLYEKTLKTKMQKFCKVPLRVMIENTNMCNADCVFCPHKEMKRQIGCMDLSLTKRIIDECTRCGINYVTIYGFGEPLLDKLFFDRVKYAKDKGIERVTTNTNAAFLNETRAGQVLDSDLDEIYISFDAAAPETHKTVRPHLDFENIEKNIKGLIELRNTYRRSKPKIFLSFVETPDNAHEVQQYINQWRKAVDGISISLMHNWTGSINRRHEHKPYKRDPCRLLWTDMVISWNGDTPLCCNDYENKVVLGNIKESPIEEIWGGEKINEIREYHRRGKFDRVPTCAKCEYNYHHKSPWWVEK